MILGVCLDLGFLVRGNFVVRVRRVVGDLVERSRIVGQRVVRDNLLGSGLAGRDGLLHVCACGALHACVGERGAHRGHGRDDGLALFVVIFGVVI